MDDYKPIINSYRIDDRVYAGEYAGDFSNPQAKVKSLVNFGITHFVDLTEENELAPYNQFLPEGCVHHRYPIRDVSIPDDCEGVYALMQYFDAVLANSSNMIYIHCWGGVGRTGVIVGCYYVYRGATYEQALKLLRQSFKQCPKSERRKTPETQEQEEFIRRFTIFMETNSKSDLTGEEKSFKSKCKSTVLSIFEKVKMLISTFRGDSTLKTELIMTRENTINKCRGSLVGGAIGDAFGYPVEFVNSFEMIQAKYGEKGITEYDKSYPWLDEHIHHYKALLSDDTQMTLYTAEGLIESRNRETSMLPTICNAYIAWYGPQVGRKVRITYDSKLAKIDELNQRRAPGSTCLTALNDIYKGHEPHNTSKGCGGIMRTAPIGIFGATHDWTLKKTGIIAGEAAELTHQHKMSTFASAVQAMIIQSCILAEDAITSETFKQIVEDALAKLPEMYPGYNSLLEDFVRLMHKAIKLEDNLLRDWEIIENGLGGGWVAEETLAISIFSVLRHINDFKACMICAVNHGGDSDSTGAVAGNIIGSILGYDAIPDEFTNSLQLHDLIVKMSDDLIEQKY